MQVDGRDVSGASDTDLVVGRTLVQHDGRAPWGLAALFLLPGVGMLSVALSFPLELLGIAGGLVGLGLLHAGWGPMKKALEINRRKATVEYGLRDVRYRDLGGERRLPLEKGLEHALGSLAPSRLSDVLRARAALEDQPDDSAMRKAMEWAAWKTLEGSQAYLHIIVPKAGRIWAASPDEDEAEWRRSVRDGDQVFWLQLQPRGSESRPVFERRAIRRVKRAAGR